MSKRWRTSRRAARLVALLLVVGGALEVLAAAQYPLRPPARVEFSLASRRLRGIDPPVDVEKLRLGLEDKLFGATFLRRPVDAEVPRVTLRVALVEKYADAEEFPLSFLVFTLEGSFDPPLPAGLELRWPLRSLRTADRDLTDVLIARDVLERADEVRANANLLVRALLCHVSVYPSPLLDRPATAGLYRIERPASRAGLKLVLPIREEELGLLRGSEFLLRTEASWGEADHYLTYSHGLRFTSPRPELAHLQGGLVLGEPAGTSPTEARPVSAASVATPSGAPAAPAGVTFVDRAADLVAEGLLLSDHEPLEDPPVRLPIRAVQVLRAVPAEVVALSPPSAAGGLE